MAKEKQTGEKQKLTPMMQQYMAVKEQNPDAILFYRLGDFYEMFFEDAKVASRELELTLTGRDCGLPERAPMCGVPFHSAESYIARLMPEGLQGGHLRADGGPGHRQRFGEAGCDPEDHLGHPAGKHHAGREAEQLHLRHPVGRHLWGRALFLRHFHRPDPGHRDVRGADLAGAVISELARFEPSEAVLSPKAMEQEEVLAFLTKRLSCQIERRG